MEDNRKTIINAAMKTGFAAVTSSLLYGLAVIFLLGAVYRYFTKDTQGAITFGVFAFVSGLLGESSYRSVDRKNPFNGMPTVTRQEKIAEVIETAAVVNVAISYEDACAVVEWNMKKGRYRRIKWAALSVAILVIPTFVLPLHYAAITCAAAVIVYVIAKAGMKTQDDRHPRERGIIASIGKAMAEQVTRDID